MFGLAGAVVPFLSNMFTELGNAPAVVGGTVLVYLASRFLLGRRVPAILPALVAGVAFAALTGQFDQAPALRYRCSCLAIGGSDYSGRPRPEI